MPNQERPLKDRIWEFTKDISVKVSRKAEKHWKINTLRVEIASIKHRINVKYKELGRYLFESQKAGALDSDSYRSGSMEFFEELKDLEAEVVSREQRIELLELELPPVSYAEEVARYRDFVDVDEDEVPPVPVIPDDEIERNLAELKALVQANRSSQAEAERDADTEGDDAAAVARALEEELAAAEAELAEDAEEDQAADPVETALPSSPPALPETAASGQDEESAGGDEDNGTGEPGPGPVVLEEKQ